MDQTPSKKFLQGTIVVILFMVVSAAFGYALKFVFARTLSVENIGLLYSVLGLIAFFGFIRDLGLSDALVYFIPRFLVDKKEGKIKAAVKYTLFVQVLVGVLFFVIILVFSDLITKYYFREEDAKLLLLFLSIFFILDGIIEVLFSIFQGYQNMFLNQAIGFSFQVFSFLFLMVLIASKVELKLFGLAYIFGAVITIALFLVLCLRFVFKNYFSVKEDYKNNLKGEMLNYSLPAMMGTLADQIFSQQTIFLLTFLLGVRNVGYYVMALSLSKVSIYFFKAMNMVFFPIMTQMWKKRQIKKLNFFIKELISFSYIVGLPLAITLMFFSDEILLILYGENFLPASTLLKIECLFYIFVSFNSLMKRIFMSLGKPKVARNLTYISLFSNLILNILLIPFFGLVGAGLADLVSVMLASAASIYYKREEKQIKLPYLPFLKILVASFVYLGFIYLFNQIINLEGLLKLSLLVALAGAIYLFILFLLKILRLDALNNMIKLATNDKFKLPFFSEEIDKQENKL